MPPCDFTPEKYQSLGYNRVLEIHKEHLSPVVTAFFQKPLLLHQGHMEWLFDAEGNRYLDFFSGIVTVSVGHCHPNSLPKRGAHSGKGREGEDRRLSEKHGTALKVNAVAQKQLGRLWHTSAIFFHAPIHEYAEKLAALLPEPLKVIFLVNSGSEANDLAMLMARAHSNNIEIISFRQCVQMFFVALGEEATVEILQCKPSGSAAVHQVWLGRRGASGGWEATKDSNKGRPIPEGTTEFEKTEKGKARGSKTGE
ncbi:alanine--glyoxylate aminotransferase 2 [Saguinus oedipus]|uniref:Alanine--glyoxylate aminotransferase 2, mitochondrial n=1 Tax=Saguinus oedipus TaxID=9490 RepID=A0ABQ9W9H6_SAGOE|nr:alanine--glyoxylate aminotransferase 2 [Saguinus oedipus]